MRQAPALLLALLATPALACPAPFKARVLRPSIVEARAEVPCGLAGDPDVARHLVREARLAVEEAARTAAAEARGKPPGERTPLAFTWDVARTAATDRYVSILATRQEAWGGARPIFVPEGFVWDRQGQKALALSDLLAETAPDGPALAALRDGVRAALRDQAGDGPGILEAIKAEPDSFKAWTLAAGPDGRVAGINIHYGSGRFLAHVVEAFVPGDVLAPHLAPAHRDLFRAR
ncbi:MAG TPA: hypothetical protein VEA41_16495 [Salinarimonas sp.]|nr:hypothetical protein [Salinarimonas sp.]